MDVDHSGRLLAGTRVLPADHDLGDAVVLAVLAEQKFGWQGPTDIQAALEELPTLLPGGEPAVYDELLLQVRDAIAMGLSTVPIIIVLVGGADHAELAAQAPRPVRQPSDRRIPVGSGRAMPFTKTEVDIHDDYVVEAVDPAWLAQGVKSPKHLMLDPDNCILCRACEDVCPWNCIYMMSPGIVSGSAESRRGRRGRQLERHVRRRRQRVHPLLRVRRPVPHRHAVLCATARGFQGGARTMAEVPTSQAEAE